MRSPGAAFELRAALTDEIRNAMQELDASPSPKPKEVHKCRVHLKRARALARVGRSVAPGLSAVFNESARSVMKSLAEARDLAALAGYARDQAKAVRGKKRSAFNDVADALDAERDALPPLNLDAVRAGLRDLLALAQVWPEASDRQIEKGAERVAKRARRAFKRGRGKDVAMRRHEWRKREKDRLYAVTLLDGHWPGKHKRRKKRGESLAEALGRERDALMLIDRLERAPVLAGGEKQADRLLTLLHKRRQKCGARADLIGDRLHSNGA